MRTRTVFLSRLIGLFLLLLSASMIVHKEATVQAVNLLFKEPAVMLALGMLGLLGGIAMVLTHNVWSGGTLAVAVTLLGWVLLLRSLFVLFMPSERIVRLLESFAFEDRFYLYLSIPFLVGLALTYAGFRPASINEHRQS